MNICSRKLLLITTTWLCTAHHAAAADPLPALTIDLPRTSVSGLSSGAFMAGQFHVAFSGSLSGAGIVAGGPYGCAEGRLDLALNRCMQTSQGLPDPAALAAKAGSLAASGAIDPLANLADNKIYVFTGKSDRTVLSSVATKVPDFYTGVGVPAANIRLDAASDAGHGSITENGPVPCATTSSPFVNDCDLDQARAILEHVYGPLRPPATTAHAPASFDQTVYLPTPEGKGMSMAGRVYIPTGCVPGTSCRLHVAFHGCKQTEELVGDAFTVGAGFNRWAESNNIVVLYPQAHDTPANPNACWDWWGYTGPAYATKTGVQMAAVHRMMLALAGQQDDGPPPSCARFDDWNVAHWQAGRVVVCNFGFACAAGSGEVLGNFLTASTVYEHPAGFYTSAACGS